jgi:hypothetical protein
MHPAFPFFIELSLCSTFECEAIESAAKICVIPVGGFLWRLEGSKTPNALAEPSQPRPWSGAWVGVCESIAQQTIYRLISFV